MSLWADKYRPNSLDKLDYHKNLSINLKKLVANGDFPHLLVYGPPGSGKKTRVMCLLKEVYGSGVEKLRLEHHDFVTPSKKKIEITTVASNYHIEVNPSDAGIHDRVVIQELIKTVASTNQLDTSQQGRFKVVLLSEVDSLTKDAQHALRRTMEKYTSSCRLVLMATCVSRVIAPLRSRCLTVRVPAPSEEEITDILSVTASKEGYLIEADAIQVKNCDRNLRRALLMMEVSVSSRTEGVRCADLSQYSANNQLVLSELDWKIYLRETAVCILNEQSPKRLLEVRERLYTLLSHCIPPDVIMKGLLKEMLLTCDGALKGDLVQLAASYEHRLHLGSKPIFHLEAFVSNFMALYKKFIDEAMVGDWDDL